MVICVTSREPLLTVSVNTRRRISLDRSRSKLSSLGDVKSMVTREAMTDVSTSRNPIGLPFMSSTADSLCVRKVLLSAVPSSGNRLIVFTSSISKSTVTIDEFSELTCREPVSVKLIRLETFWLLRRVKSVGSIVRAFTVSLKVRTS